MAYKFELPKCDINKIPVQTLWVLPTNSCIPMQRELFKKHSHGECFLKSWQPCS